MDDPSTLRNRLDTALMGDISDHRARLSEIHTVVTDLGVRLARIEERLGYTERNAAEHAAKLAVTEVFLRLGVDVNNPVDMAKFSSNLSVGNTVRDAVQKGVRAALAGAAGVGCTLLWILIRNRIGVDG